MARSKVKSRSHYDVTHLHPQPMSLPNINFLHLTGSEIQARQTLFKLHKYICVYIVHISCNVSLPTILYCTSENFSHNNIYFPHLRNTWYLILTYGQFLWNTLVAFNTGLKCQ